ncbi:MAG: hypothetical protein ABI434_04585 [Burkholderiaceae bacterium]
MIDNNFTEASYRSLLERTAREYQFVAFDSSVSDPRIVLRHDLDTSLHRALALAKIEAELGISATYFLFPRSLYYNLLHPTSMQLVNQIVGLGHSLGLHFDVSMPYEQSEFSALLDQEKRLLEQEFRRDIEAVSFHLAGNFESRLPKQSIVSGMVNAYSTQMREQFKYVSDSNGVWRFDRWEDVIDPNQFPRLHILIHPEWWTPEAMTPRQRLQRAIDGYAHEMGSWYDEVTKTYGRPNY